MELEPLLLGTRTHVNTNEAHDVNLPLVLLGTPFEEASTEDARITRLAANGAAFVHPLIQAASRPTDT